LKNYFIILIALLTVSCSKGNVKPVPPSSTANCDCTQQTESPADDKRVELQDYALLKPAKWQDIDGFAEDDISAAWPAWQKSCSTLKNKTQNNQQPWQVVCAAASALNKPDKQTVQAYFAEYFNVYGTSNADGNDTGLITGYYQPLLKGSLTKSSQYPHPLYKQPADLITVDLGETYPELKNKRVRGKLVADKDGRKKLVPYATRAQIETANSPLTGNELVWIDDQVEGFFLQVQGSGVIQFDNGETMQVGYADQNGQAYNSIGRLLIERGELTKDQAGMQGIKDWATKNPAKLQELLNANPSYVFFRELPAGLSGPLGALGVPLTAERSIAIDPRHVPLGAPVFLSTTQPNSSKQLKKLMVAQDTGGAIKGGVRADYFWGAGDSAGKQAGSMKQQGKIWVLLPKDFQFPTK
jgi:membrane-bound lytic murein transglycosylase A